MIYELLSEMKVEELGSFIENLNCKSWTIWGWKPSNIIKSQAKQGKKLHLKSIFNIQLEFVKD